VVDPVIWEDMAARLRDVYQTHFTDLEELMKVGVGDPDLPEIQLNFKALSQRP
jgi:hypothetical protein